jgi:hypothetical protein
VFLSTESNARVFLVLVKLTWLFIGHIHKLFDELIVREKYCHVFTSDSCLHHFVLFTVFSVSNPISRANTFYIAMWS